jgi:uncharacterized membrane protein
MKNKKNLIITVFNTGLLIYSLIRCYYRPSILIIVAIIFELIACIISLGSWKTEKIQEES